MLLAKPLGTPGLLLVGATFLLLVIATAWAVAHVRRPRMPAVHRLEGATAASAGTSSGASDAGAGPSDARASPSDAGAAAGEQGGSPRSDEWTVIGGRAWEGLRAVARSRYLLGITAYIVLLAVISTFLYFTRLQMVAALGPDTDMRATMFARTDTITQGATLILRLAVTGRLMKRVGIPVTLALLPATVAAGFVGLADRRLARRAGCLRSDPPRDATGDHAPGARDAFHRGRPRGQVQVEGGDRHLRLSRRRRGRRLGRRTARTSRHGADCARLGGGPLALAWGALGIRLGRRQSNEAARRSVAAATPATTARHSTGGA